MPADISTGPTAVTAGTPPGRAFGLTVGPPGSDPLAALFAALLANSAGSLPTVGTASSLLKPSALPKLSILSKMGDEPAGDKTQNKISNAALMTQPPLPAPIQMRPTLPPAAGVSAGQETKDTKTMDTSPVPAFPLKEKASVTGGELPLQDARMTASSASTLSPVFLITPPLIVTPSIVLPAIAPAPIMSAPIMPAMTASVVPLAVPPVGKKITAPPASQEPPAAAPTLPVVQRDLPGMPPLVPPGVFALGAVAVPTQTTAGNAPQSSLPTGPTAPAATPPVALSALSQTAPVDYVPQPHGIAVSASAVQVLTKLPAGETAAADSPAVTPPVLVPTAVVGAVRGIVPALPQAIIAAAVQTAANGSNVTEGKAAKEGVGAKEGNAATDGAPARDGEVTTEGIPATDGKIATDGKMSTVGETPKTGLKSAVVSADTITRSQAVPAKTLPSDRGLQTADKRSERRAENVGSDAPLALPTTLPTQAGAMTTEAKPLSAADRAEMIRQVADGVGAMPLPAKADASSQMTLQLHPKDWGQLQVSVKIVPGTDPGAVQTVTAHIVAETPQVKAALDNHSGDLRQSLREAGLHLDKISVTVQRMEASAQAGTATSGGRHEASHGGTSQGRAGAFGETASNPQTGMSDETGTSSRTGMSDTAGNGMPSFTASGGSQGGRQGGQPPAYASAYASAEPEDMPAPEITRRPTTSQVDIRA